MKLVFNRDGSIKLKSIDASIQQGNTGINHIDCAVEGYSPDAYTMTCVFQLPNGDINQLIGTQTVDITLDTDTYTGKRVTLTDAQTYYAGILKLNIVMTDASDNTLFTYTIYLTINPTAYIPTVSTITGQQYTNMVSALATKQDKYVTTNARYYKTEEDAQADKENLSQWQVAVVYDPRTTGTFASYYTKDSDGNLVKRFEITKNEAIAVVTLPVAPTTGTLTQDQYNTLIASDHVIINKGDEIYRLNDRFYDTDHLVYSHIGYNCEESEQATSDGWVKQIVIDSNTKQWYLATFMLPGIASRGSSIIMKTPELYVDGNLETKDLYAEDTQVDNLLVTEDLEIQGQLITKKIALNDFLTPVSGIEFNPNGCEIFIINNVLYACLEFKATSSVTGGTTLANIASSYRPYPFAVYNYSMGTGVDGIRFFTVKHTGELVSNQALSGSSSAYAAGGAYIATCCFQYVIHN